MKLAKHNNTLQTNTDNESHSFGIGNASIVIEILRNRLYKHKVRTLVQEYISNARDANREADSKRDVEVSIPTAFEPTFKVRDYGFGISPDRIKNVFVLYGSSTKRDSNNQTGGFGIGAKSAWSYTDSFNIITYIDGTKRTYLAHTGVDNNGRLDFLSEVKTSEENGTEIQIAVNPDDIRQFCTSIDRAIHFWSENIILKGCDYEKSDLSRGLFVADNIEVIQDSPDGYGFDSYYDNAILAIDGILYPVDRDIVRELDTNMLRGKVVLHVPTGQIEVSASREEITINTENKQKISCLIADANFAINKYVDDKLKGKTKIKDILEVISELNTDFNITHTQGKYTINRGMVKHDGFKDVVLTQYYVYRSKLKKTQIGINSKSYGTGAIKLANIYFFDNSESMVKRNKRIRKFLETNQEITVLELKESITKQYDTFKKELPFLDLKTLELPVVVKDTQVFSSPKIKRASVEFCLHLPNSGYYAKTSEYTSLTSNTKLWYYIEMTGNSYGKRSKLELTQIADKFNVNVCGLSPTNIKRVSGNKNFQSFDEYIKLLKPTNDDISFMQFTKTTNEGSFGKIDVETIKNKKIKDMMLKYENIKKSNTKMIPTLVHKRWIEHKDVIDFVKKDDDVSELLLKCPLLLSITNNRWDRELDKKDVSLYINTKLKGDK